MLNFSSDAQQWMYPFEFLLQNGKLSSPKGNCIIEVENFSITMNPLWNVCKYKERKINLGYMLGEMCWYMRGDRNDDSILYYSKFWNKVKNNEQPHYNSNYGYYAFVEKQLVRCLDMLLVDKDSRQAAIIISTSEAVGKSDTPCTYAVSFRIRQNKLNMTVHMRSNDIWRGFCIDMFQFSIWQQILYWRLFHHYTDLQLGTYTHVADSFHAYENTFDALETIVSNGYKDWDESTPNFPMLTPWDVLLGFNKLLLIEEGLRLNIKTDLQINKSGFCQFAAEQLKLFTQNKIK
jgi:thymidylate synthase